MFTRATTALLWWCNAKYSWVDPNANSLSFSIVFSNPDIAHFHNTEPSANFSKISYSRSIGLRGANTFYQFRISQSVGHPTFTQSTDNTVFWVFKVVTNHDLLCSMALGRRILIADDNALMRKMLCKMFSEHATLEVCEEAKDGRQGFEKAANCDPDLIILDLSMPVLNGLEAARIIGCMLPAVPIILFMQHAALFENLQIDRSGVSRIVSKMEIQSLASRVEELLRTFAA